ncbi:MAG TPA: hypothetical protein VFM61_01970, partial [Pseudidiomarina sp.]|nr:hypothetical protein [Pseudidiomarina sp.]
MKYWLVGMVNVLILVFSVGCSDPVQQSRSGTNTLEVDNIASVGTANIRFSITPARPQPES